MMRNIILIAAMIAGAVNASPAAVQKMTANFDNIKVIPAAPLLNTIGVYKGLKYEGWLVNDGTLATTGVKVSSPPNALNHAITSEGLNAIFGFGVNGTNTKSFDLYSMDLGCVLDLQNDAAGPASPCTLLLQGYTDSRSQQAHAEKIITYRALKPRKDALLKDLFTVIFPKEFRGLQKFRIRQVDSLGGEVTNSVVMDTVVYALHH